MQYQKVTVPLGTGAPVETPDLESSSLGHSEQFPPLCRVSE